MVRIRQFFPWAKAYSTTARPEAISLLTSFFACGYTSSNRLRIRNERRADLHQSLLELACGIICLRRPTTSFRNDQQAEPRTVASAGHETDEEQPADPCSLSGPSISFQMTNSPYSLALRTREPGVEAEHLRGRAAETWKTPDPAAGFP